MNEAQPRGAHDAKHDHCHAHGAECDHPAVAPCGAGASAVTDPVCGMTVDPRTSKHRFDYHGETFHFCSARCRERFAADPGEVSFARRPRSGSGCPDRRDLDLPDAPRDPAGSDPGNCPICGMALEPVVPSAETGPNPELRDMSRRFWIGAGAHGAGFVLAMGGFIPGAESRIA